MMRSLRCRLVVALLLCGTSLASPRQTVKRVPGTSEQAVDLTKLGARPKPPEAKPTTSAEPAFRMMFDLLFARQPGKANLSFLNFHPLLFLEVVPTKDLSFGFEVNPRPRYFELTWDATPMWRLRGGKLRLPFDDFDHHNIFGGIVNTSRMRLGNVALLPDIWADLGVGTRVVLVDYPDVRLEAHFALVNGFASGGTDPTGTLGDYPNFGPDLPVNISDNNDDKAAVGRVHILASRMFGLGISAYTGRWTDESKGSERILMLGADSQIYLGKVTLRAGFTAMSVGLIDQPDYQRQGEYAEGSCKFGGHDEWKVTGRLGYSDTDSRFSDENDLLTLGSVLAYKPSLIEWSLMHYQDLKRVDGKRGYTFTALRAVIQL